MNLERISRLAYIAFIQKSNAFAGMPWESLSLQTRNAWEAATTVAIEESNKETLAEIPPPLFAPLDSFDTEALKAFRHTWRKIRSDPQWAFWHSHAPEALEAIEAEIAKRNESGNQAM